MMSAAAPAASEDPPAWQPPPFCRTSWSSAAARAWWEPRLIAARAALEDLAVLRSAQDGVLRIVAVRPASLGRLRGLAATRGVRLESLGAAPAAPDAVAAGRFGRLLVAIGEGAALVPDNAPCPAPANEDPVWRLALRTAAAEPFDEGKGLVVAGDWAANPLLAPVGLSATSAWPAAFDCDRAAAEGAALLAAAETHGLSAAIRDLREALSWPTSWSALHGIAEVKTPVFRFIRSAPPTRQRITVRRQGAAFPEQAARGLGFPFLTRANPRNRAPR